MVIQLRVGALLALPGGATAGAAAALADVACVPYGDSPEQRGSWTYRKGTGTPLLWQAAVDVGLVHRVFGRLLCSFNVEAAVQQARRGADAVTSAPLTNRELYWVGGYTASCTGSEDTSVAHAPVHAGRMRALLARPAARHRRGVHVDGDAAEPQPTCTTRGSCPACWPSMSACQQVRGAATEGGRGPSQRRRRSLVVAQPVQGQVPDDKCRK